MTYIIPIFDKETDDIWIQKIVAATYKQAEAKVMNYINSTYDFEEDLSDDYHEFKKELESQNIYLGNLTDVETL